MTNGTKKYILLAVIGLCLLAAMIFGIYYYNKNNDTKASDTENKSDNNKNAKQKAKEDAKGKTVAKAKKDDKKDDKKNVIDDGKDDGNTNDDGGNANDEGNNSNNNNTNQTSENKDQTGNDDENQANNKPCNVTANNNQPQNNNANTNQPIATPQIQVVPQQNTVENTTKKTTYSVPQSANVNNNYNGNQNPSNLQYTKNTNQTKNAGDDENNECVADIEKIFNMADKQVSGNVQGLTNSLDARNQSVKPTTTEHTLAIESFKNYRDTLKSLKNHLQDKVINFKLRTINNGQILMYKKIPNDCEFLNLTDDDEYQTELNDFGYKKIKNNKYEKNIKKFLKIYSESVNAIEELMIKQNNNPEEQLILEDSEKKAINYILKIIGSKTTRFYKTYGLVTAKNNVVMIALTPQHKSSLGNYDERQLEILKTKIIQFANTNNINLMTADVKDLFNNFCDENTDKNTFRNKNPIDRYNSFIKAYNLAFEEVAKTDKIFEDKKFDVILQQSEVKADARNAIFEYLLKNKLLDPNQYHLNRLFGLNKDAESCDTNDEESDVDQTFQKAYATYCLKTNTVEMLKEAFNFSNKDIRLHFTGLKVTAPIYDEDDESTEKYKSDVINSFFVKSDCENAPKHLCKLNNCLICKHGVIKKTDEDGNRQWIAKNE